MKSWKTTTIAVLTVVVLAAGATINMLDTDPATVADWNKVIVAAIAALQAVGFFAAKDHNQ